MLVLTELCLGDFSPRWKVAAWLVVSYDHTTHVLEVKTPLIHFLHIGKLIFKNNCKIFNIGELLENTHTHTFVSVTCGDFP